MAQNLILVRHLGLPFLLSVPPSESGATRQWPVLCFLHGLDEGGPVDIYSGLTAHGPLKPESSAHATREFIVAAPQLPVRGDLWRSHADMVYEVVEYIRSRYDCDRKRTYLTGFSFGGNGVFDVALVAPSIWTALWAVDPTRVPESDPGLPVWLSCGQACRPILHRFIDRLKLRPLGTGSDERVYSDEGLDHVATASSAYGSDTVFKWLLSKHG